MSRIKPLLLLLALALQLSLASATTTITYAVGTCQPKLKSFATISAALAATPAPSVVEVCPGTYPEQIEITIPVTLEGITANNSTQAVIAVPSGGLVKNATLGVAAQVWVNNASGEVNLTNLTVDGTGNNLISSSFMAGVFYVNSPGTLSHLTIRNQNGTGQGYGVWLMGGSAKPSVTLENSNVLGSDNAGVNVQLFDSTTSQLTATVKGNYVAAGASVDGSFPAGIALQGGATATISGNLITGGYQGVIIQGLGSGGTVSTNTIVNSGGQGMSAAVAGVSVTSNTIYNVLNGTGMVVWSDVPPVTGNTIVAAGTAIDFTCNAGANVHSNTIQGMAQGIWNVPPVVVVDAFFNVGTLRGTNEEPCL